MTSQELQDRIEIFVKRLMDLLRSLPKTKVNLEYGGQCLRSGGSTGANYVEACDSDSRSDFVRRIRLCKREAKETAYWLRLLMYGNPERKNEFEKLLNELNEFVRIFSQSIKTSLKNKK